MCAAALPLADDVVAFGNQIGGTPEVEVRERTTEIGHEGLDIVTAATRCSEYFSNMSGVAISSTTARLHFSPQNSVN
jgi:hypothetical protein